MSIAAIAQNTPISRYFLGSGDDAAHNTLLLMRQIIRRSYNDLYIRLWAEKIIENTVKNDLLRLSKVWEFCTHNLIYLYDPNGTETIKTPRFILAEIESGKHPLCDCDCMTVLLMTLAKTIGFEVAIRAISMQDDRAYDHVYGMVFIDDPLLGVSDWISADLTRPDLGLGWEYPEATRIKTVRV